MENIVTNTPSDNEEDELQGVSAVLENSGNAEKCVGSLPGLGLLDDCHPYKLYMEILEEDSSEEEEMFQFDFRGVVPRVIRRRRFEENITPREYRQRFRVPMEVVDFLEHRLHDVLTYPSLRNNPLSAREQILMFLFFTGTNSLYHVVKEARGPVESTVCRTLKRYVIVIKWQMYWFIFNKFFTFHRVCKAIVDIQEDMIGWPENPGQVARAFYNIANFPGVVGVIDGTHIEYTPPILHEQEYVNRHQTHSFNMCAVSGPTYMFYYVNSATPGRSHDSGVLRRTMLWQQWEVEKYRPFHGAVILGDSAYTLTDWMMTPFRVSGLRPLTQAQKAYQKAHVKTRTVVERAFGILKMRFRALFKSGLRVMSMNYAADIITACVILHNLCIAHNDNVTEFLENLEEHFPTVPRAIPVTDKDAQEAQTRRRRRIESEGNTRRNQIVQSFASPV